MTKNLLYYVLVDFLDVYPSIRHETFFEILLYFRFLENVTNLLSHLHDQHFIQVFIGFGLTNLILFKKGLLQGDSFSLIAYNIYAKVIAQVLTNYKRTHNKQLGFNLNREHILL